MEPQEVPEPLYDAHGQDVLLRALPIGGIRGKADVDGGEGARRRADGGGGQWAAPHLDRFVLFVVRQRPPAVGRKCLGQPGPLRVIGGPGGERPAPVHQHGAHQVDGACIQSGVVGSHAILPGSLGGLRRGRQIRGQLAEIVGPGPLAGPPPSKVQVRPLSDVHATDLIAPSFSGPARPAPCAPSGSPGPRSCRRRHCR